jgi:dolichyl-diphosphooligosaccharide--protein glycosyltransferase
MGSKAKTAGKGKVSTPQKAEKEEEAKPAYEEDDIDINGFGNAKAPIVMRMLAWLLRIGVLVAIGYEAYDIRLYAIKEYGRVIHEFDPWFNFRATQYLADNGWKAFFHWYDYMSWYPLGRPVGTTIYPGMQMTSVFIWETLKNSGYAAIKMSLNDVCCFVPAWFGVVATMFLGLLTTECSGSSNAGVFAAAIMSIIPAHIMRSVGGGYDNESIAVSAMCATFYFWVRSLRNDHSWWIGAIAGVAYGYMVAVWGGYIFVLNMIGVHTAVLVLMGQYSTKLHRAYSLWFVVGTTIATHVPVVGWSPLKSLEQLAPLAVFIGMQLLELCEIIKRKKNLSFLETMQLRVQVFGAVGGLLFLLVAALYPTGYFGPISARVRGLFVKHTRTGNPLVDSVAEHQPANANAYWQFLHWCVYIAPVGWGISLFNRTDSKYFLLAYGIAAYYFSNRMMRLIIIAGPVCSALSGVFLGYVLDFTAAPLLRYVGWASPEAGLPWAYCNIKDASPDDKRRKKGTLDYIKRQLWTVYKQLVFVWDLQPCRLVRVAAGLYFLASVVPPYAREFHSMSHQMAQGMSNPQIMIKAHLRDGTAVMVDDYREAYWWLRDNTPKDSRVMAWWDYGYQITGIGNRTTIADGNTWNHEHIATLGRCLTAPVKEAHRNIRHLADYVLVWAGGGGDDLAKSPHLARIANSVFDDVCPGDPTCRYFGFDHQGSPTPMMEASLLYNLHSHNMRAGVNVDSNRFKHVFTSKYGKVRIFKVMSVSQESKDWVADPANKVCDAPGSWYCTGQYPPALDNLIARRQAFSQLEDFNRNKDAESKKKSERYNKEYMARMEGGGGGSSKNYKPSLESTTKKQWADTDDTKKIKKLIQAGDASAVASALGKDSALAKVRSKDGRGPLWWAYAGGNDKIIALLKKAGAREDARDAKGMKPVDMKK